MIRAHARRARSLAGAAALMVAAASGPPPGEGDAMAGAARTFLSTLRPELRARAVHSYTSDERRDWHYVPRRRAGVSFQQMNAAERAAAHALLRAGLSARGYEKATGIVVLEGILREIETFGFRRDPELYFLTIFGAPSAGSPWGWRFEGHHVSLNFSSATREISAATPAFYGANPARVPAGRPRAGWRVLAAEEDLARKLLENLDPSQRAVAVISPDAPSEILMTPSRDAAPAPSGLAFERMTPAQRKILIALIGEYVDNLQPAIAQAHWRRIRGTGLDTVRFAWAGGTAPGEGHYYRVQGPAFIMEYDNTQDRANHIHTVWRSLESDFGGDLLRRHYLESPHHADARARAQTLGALSGRLAAMIRRPSPLARPCSP